MTLIEKKGKTMKKIKLSGLLLIIMLMSLLAGCSGKEQGNTPDPGISPSVTQTPIATPIVTPVNTVPPTPTVSPSPTDTPTPSPTTAVSISMVGDVLLHTRIEKDCKQEDGSYDYNSIFSNTTDLIKSFDLALVNQEVIIGGAELGISAYPSFNADYSLAEALVNAGFDVALHATNHALDKRKDGIINCINNWKKYPSMKVMGIYETQEEADNQIYYYEKDGITIAFLNFTYGTNGISLPKDMPYCVGPLLTKDNQERIAALLDKAAENSDFLVVLPHWGTEYNLKESREQREWNSFFYRHGVNLVIGTHPHVVEPIAITDDSGTRTISEYEVDENNHRVLPPDAMLTFYSLGNYVNWTGEKGDEKYQRMVGAMAGITLSKDADGRVFILDFNVTPLVSHVVTGKNQVTVYKLTEYTEELAQINEIKKQSELFSLSNLKAVCDKVFGELWKR